MATQKFAPSEIRRKCIIRAPYNRFDRATGNFLPPPLIGVRSLVWPSPFGGVFDTRPARVCRASRPVYPALPRSERSARWHVQWPHTCLGGSTQQRAFRPPLSEDRTSYSGPVVPLFLGLHLLRISDSLLFLFLCCQRCLSGSISLLYRTLRVNARRRIRFLAAYGAHRS